MKCFTHTLSDGLKIAIHLKRSAKKNLLLRPVDNTTISINIPPSLSMKRLEYWLNHNEHLVRPMLSKQPAFPATDTKPDWIWYHGARLALNESTQHAIAVHSQEILLPTKSWAQQHLQLRRFLQERAAEYLLPRLNRYANEMNMHPAATALTNAKTFWGVCRHTTGIRINWRLIGAPDFVADYICIHELCHLPHPDHSARFWKLVNSHTPHTEAAEHWLKTHGRDLFRLG